MRKMLFAAAVLLSTAPALAQPPAYDPAEDQAEAPAPYLDEQEVAHAARAMDRLVGAIMDLPVGGIVAAVDPYGRGPVSPNARVRDFAEPGAENRIRQDIRGTARSVYAANRAIQRAMPALRRSIEDLRRSMALAIAEAEGDD